MAETIHSFSDTLNQVLVLISIKRSKKPADRNHPFGYGKERFLWPFLVATLLFSVSGIFSTQFGFFPILQNHFEPLKNVEIGYIVLAAAAIIEGKALMSAFASIKNNIEARGQKVTAKTLIQEFRENKEPTTMTVLVEDSIAVFAAIITAVGIYLSKATGNGVYDATSAIIVGSFLMGFAFVLAREFKDLLVGKAISKQELDKISSQIMQVPEVGKIVSIKSMHLSTDDVLIVLDITVNGKVKGDEVAEIVQSIEGKVKEAVPYADKSKIYIKFDSPLHQKGIGKTDVSSLSIA